MKLDIYIKEILFAKDLVVIPNFGAFVSKHFAAEINEATQMFMPPTKKVTFQPALNGNDLTLINHVSRAQSCTLQQATILIEKTVKSWNQSLADGRHILLDDIGRIYKDVQGNLAFQADINTNFNTNSFGLGIFRFPLLKDEASLHQQVSKVLPLSVRKQNGKGGYWKAAAIFIGVVGLLYLGSQKSDFKGLDYANFNPLHFSKTIKVESPKATPENSIEVKITPATETSTKVEPVVKETVISPVKETVAVKEIEVAKPYHVIVGAFKEKQNATGMITSLNNKGFTEAVFFLDRGLYKVSVNQFSLKADAKSALSNYKTKVQKGAWIYKK